MIDDGTVIFRSDNLLIRHVPGGESDVAFVTFDCYTEQDTLDRPGFGEHYFRHQGIPAFHVLQRRNRWWQHPELDAALAALRQRLGGYRKVITYGSSMGGFAALTYGGAIGAHSGLALSPQFSVDPRVAPFERRWRSDIAAIRFLKGGRGPSLPCQYIAFDPMDASDARHAALFAAQSPTLLLPARFGGHPVGAYLNETGVLPFLLKRLIASDDDDPHLAEEIGAQLRRRRRRSGQYLFALAQKTPHRRMHTKLALAKLAAETGAGNPVYASYHATVLDMCGRHGEALPIHRRAYCHPVAGAAVAWDLMGHHVARGEEAEAERIGREALQRFPRSPQLRRKVRWLVLRRHLRLDRLMPSLGRSLLLGTGTVAR